MPGGRPKNFTKPQVEQIKKLLCEYIEKEDIPIIAEFAYKHDVPRNTLYDYPEFSTLIKKMIDKKESALEKKALKGDVNSTMAIFSLKQLGWRDKQEMEHSGQVGIKIVEDI